MLNKHYRKIPTDVLVFSHRVLKTNPKGYEGKTFLLLLNNGRMVIDEALYIWEKGLFTQRDVFLPHERKNYPDFVGRHSFMFSQPEGMFEDARAYSQPS